MISTETIINKNIESLPKRTRHLRILMIVLSHYPNDPRVRREAEALVQSKHNVDVICMRSPHESVEETCSGIRVHRIIRSQNKENIIQYMLLTMHFFIKSMIYLNRLNRLNHFDLIQIHNMPDYLVFTTIIQKINGIPIILDLHDIMKELFNSRWKGGIQRFFIPFISFIEKLSWNYSDALITTSLGFKKCLRKRGIKENKITLIYNSADPKIFNNPRTSWKISPNSPKLLYHGTVAERFGIHIAIKAVKELAVNYPGIQFNIYGNYQKSYKQLLLNLIRTYRLEKNVLLHEYVTLEKISKIIRESDLGIVPYLSDNFMNLALSTKTFEYVAMKLPVIASDIPSIRSIFNDEHIYFFRQGDANHLSIIINDLINDGKFLEQKVNDAINISQHLNWPEMAKEYVALVERFAKREEFSA